MVCAWLTMSTHVEPQWRTALGLRTAAHKKVVSAVSAPAPSKLSVSTILVSPSLQWTHTCQQERVLSEQRNGSGKTRDARDGAHSRVSEAGAPLLAKLRALDAHAMLRLQAFAVEALQRELAAEGWWVDWQRVVDGVAPIGETGKGRRRRWRQ
jgi:hypothetical protein